MQVKRCAQLMVGLECETRFDIQGLLAGGTGRARRQRWRAYAPHLPAPVEVDLATLAVVEAVPDDTWTPRGDVEARFGAERVAAVIASGLLLDDGPATAATRETDQAAREVDWWPPALVAQAHGAWSGVDVGGLSAAGEMPSARQLVDTFGPAPGAVVQRRPGAATLPLPKPPGTGFDALLAARRTCRNFDPAAVLPAGDFATMLRRVWGALGTRELAPGAVAVKKTSPAGGGLHAVEAYVLALRVEGLAPGLYHYLAHDHALEPLQALATEDAAALARRFVAGQDWFLDAPVMVVMVARFDRLFWKYRRHAKAWRVVHLDVGHLSQTMYLSATELGLGSFVTAAINDRDIATALALPPLREGAIALVGFGARAETMTTMELDTYTPAAAASDWVTAGSGLRGPMLAQAGPGARSSSR